MATRTDLKIPYGVADFKTIRNEGLYYVDMMKMIRALAGAVTAFVAPLANAQEPGTVYDLVVYGGSSAGLAAAVQAKRMGLKAVVVSPESRIGGLTTGRQGFWKDGHGTGFQTVRLDERR